MKYNYISIWVGRVIPVEEIKSLNQYYDQGWEPVSFAPTGGAHSCILVTLRKQIS